MTIKRFILLFVSLVVGVNLAKSQDLLLQKPVSVSFSNLSVRSFLDSLANEIDAAIAYDATVIPLDSIVSVNWDAVVLKTGLYEIFGRKNIEVSSFTNQVIISRNLIDATPPIEQSIVVEGYVVDGSTLKSIPWVDVVLDNRIGVVTNNQGYFSLKVPSSNVKHKMLFSFIGYDTTSVEIPDNDTVFQIKLMPYSIELPEVTVHPINVDALMEKVVKSRNANYLQSSVALMGFFRETVSENDKYVQATEAVIEIYKPPYADNNRFENVKFIKGRRHLGVTSSNGIRMRLQGGPYHFSRLDVMRYGDFLPSEGEAPIYKYANEGGVWVNGDTYLNISFKPFVDDGVLAYKGNFLINPTTYAVASVTFEMTEKTLRSSRQYLVKKESSKLKSMPTMARYQINYRQVNNSWIISTVKGEVNIQVKDKKNGRLDSFSAIIELMVSDLRPIDGDRLRYADSFKPSYILEDQIDDSAYDADFWANYNIIEPDEKLENVFKYPVKVNH